MSDNTNQILKKFGFSIDEEKKSLNIPEHQIIALPNGKQYTFKTLPLMKISDLINSFYGQSDVGQSEGSHDASQLDISNDASQPDTSNDDDNGMDRTGNKITFHTTIDEKFLEFLIDYTKYVEIYGLPVFPQEKILMATVLESAIGLPLYELFVKHFNYKYQRSDLAVKQYIKIFGHMLECSAMFVSNSLISLFAVAHAILIKHLPSSEFIIIDD